MWVPLVIAVLGVLLALYASWTARRLDRLHTRVDTAAAALASQLLRRAEMAIAFGGSLADLDPELAVEVEDVAARAASVQGLGPDREMAESALTRELGGAVAVCGTRLEASPVTTEMYDEAMRATFARRFFNDTVRDALVVRDRRVVRWFGLAGHAPHPSYFEMDDEELAIPRMSVASGPTMDP
ncbi:MAG TPA: NUDIX hydrolase [Mycobacteriales bacterium]|nr:NUDIX hydrolase [Mycobacteriales bacterium]